ncbi:MAG: CBS domain-containing protein [Candidatus Altiarchaeota archaeon]|nr:CBS domain-containing protein [Candidatus Altiarchaeota archaeon]
MNVRDIMRKNVISIDLDATILDAMNKMVEEQITSLVIEDKGKNSVYGIITRKDIVNKVIAYDKDIKATLVSEVMSEPILSVSPDASIETVARLMAKTDIRRFPVMEGNKLVGMVSNSDIMKAVSKGLK